MKIIKTKIDGVFVLETKLFEDSRGLFIKTFHRDIFRKAALSTNFKESFYSISKKNVIRGMHFHLPPKDHAKLIYVTNGSILDVILDLRNGSPTYGKHLAINLSQKNHKAIYIPTGCAHGFLSLENNTCVVYMQTSTHSPRHDTGVRFDSFKMRWGVKKPIVSARDTGFLKLKDFKSPFNYKK